MPHLQFEVNKKIDINIKDEFIKKVMSIFSKVMDTGTDHIAVSIREYDKYSLSIGRANINDDICLMNLDIREGRTIIKRRELVLLYIDLVEKLFSVDKKNQYITLTEHKGEDFHLIEKYLNSWEKGEDPLS